MRTFEQALDIMYSETPPEPAAFFRALYKEVAGNTMAAILLKTAASKALDASDDAVFVMLTHYWMGIVTGILMMQEPTGRTE